MKKKWKAEKGRSKNGQDEHKQRGNRTREPHIQKVAEYFEMNSSLH